MAAYSVVVLPRAEADAAEHASWIAEDSPAAAVRWIEGPERAIEALNEMPNAHARVPETGRFRRKYRQIHHHAHRVLFFVDETAKTVVVARVVHGARDRLRPGDLPR